MIRLFSLLASLAVLGWAAGICLGVASPASPSGPSATAPSGMRTLTKEELRRKAAPMMARALKFQAAAQAQDGGWPGPTGASDPAITALVAQTFIQHPDYGPNHPISKRAIDFVLKFQQPDGGIYDPKMGYLNYSTSVAVMALAAMRVPAMQGKVDTGVAFLKKNQWVEGTCDNDGTDITSGHVWYGGAGYGRHKRPDLSNTQMMLDALVASGLPGDDPAIQKALKFVQRCQMRAESNDQPFASGGGDGGFIYTPANGGQSMAGTIEVDGQPRLRSYGSMTYAGFKSMIYAKVSRDDPRVQAAWDWIRSYYTLDSNPNMPGEHSKQGLYYFYHVFAKALDAWGEPTLTDSSGAVHDWRAELCEKLLTLQRPDGSWANEADRWMEDNPHLVTAYAVLSLQIVTR